MKKVAGVLIKDNNKFLLVQEKIQKAYGLWNLPAGHVDKNESLEDTAKREAKEETGVDVEVGKEIYVTNDGYAEIHIFEGKLIGGEITLNTDELLDIKWFNATEIEDLQLREESFRHLFK